MSLYIRLEHRIKEHTIDACEELAAQREGECEFVEGDVRDGAVVSKLVGDVDCVYH